MISFSATLGGNYDPSSPNTQVNYFTHADTNRQIYVGPYSSSPVYGQANFADNVIVYTGILDDQSQIGFTALGDRALQDNDGGFFWDVSGNTGPATLVGGVFGDILRTGVANDALNGGAGDDVLEAGVGTNTINGGTGINTVSYQHYTPSPTGSGVSVALNLGSATSQDPLGPSLVDTLSNIQNIRGSASNDALAGNSDANVIEGGGGGDAIVGGGGSDTASYEHSTAGVTVNLATGAASGGDAQGDTFVTVENLRGSGNADSLTGDSNSNALTGGGSDDTLDGGDGTDTAVFSGARSSYKVTHLVGGGVEIADLRNGTPDGTDTITNVESFQFSDGTLSFAQLNDAPALTGPQASLGNGIEDTAYTVSAADLLQGYTDPNGDALSVVTLAADHGTVTDNGDGTYTISLEANYNGPLALTYGVSDGSASTAATQSATIAAVNDAPVASGLTQSLTVHEDGAAAKLFTAAVSVADVDSSSLTATLTLSNAAAATLSGAAATATPGVYSITGAPSDVAAALAAVTITPATDFVGPISVGVAIGDSNPPGTTGTQPSGTVSVSVVETTAPQVASITPSTAGPTNAVSLTETIIFSEAVTGLDVTDLVVTTSSGTASGHVASVNSIDGSSYTVVVDGLSGTGTIRLDLKNSGTGISDSAGNPIAAGFTAGGTTTLDRDAPLVQADGASGTGVAGLLTGNVLANDTDASSLHLASIQFADGLARTPPAAGTVTLSGDHGLLTVAADGSYSYKPTSPGHDVFTETVTDAAGNLSQTSLTFDVAKAPIPASLTFGFALTEASFDFSHGHSLVTAPDGTVADLTGVGTIRFSDGTVQEADGNPLVDDLFYFANNLDVWRAHVASGLDAETHYDAFGWHEGRNPDAYFSSAGYLAGNPDVAAAGINPLSHYDTFGWREGRSPSADFSAEAYRALYPDVAAAGVSPLTHYLAFGQAEDRIAPPGLAIATTGDHLYGDFDATFYLAHNPDVAAAARGSGLAADSFAFTHYLTFGASEGRDPNAFFSTRGYTAANPDVAASGFDPVLHYELYGWHQGRDPSALFSTNAYLAANPDVAAAQIDPLQHYLEFGLSEGRPLA